MLEALGFERGNQYQRFARDLASVYSEGLDPDTVSLPDEDGHSPSPRFPSVDGIKFLSHGLGCGETRGISEELCGLLAGYACNPSVGGITILSLGCQHAQVSIMEDEIAKRCGFDKPLLVFEQQKYPSEREMLEQAIRQTFAGLAQINRQERSPAPFPSFASEPNAEPRTVFREFPLTRRSAGSPTYWSVSEARVILSEFPELCGVEQEIVNRWHNEGNGKSLH